MEREEVIKNVRACLISSKGGVKMDDLNKDYRLLIDENIPFRKLGYQSLVAFLRTVPSVKITEKGKDCFVEAVPTGESAHITKLIARQKTATKKYNKMVNTKRPTPFRKPMMTRNFGNIRSFNNNLYSQMSGKQNMYFPAMSTKITVHQNSEKPRYIQSNCGIPPSSPSKRLKDRQVNSVLSTNQSINKSKDETQIKNNLRTVTSVISQHSKNANINVEMLPKKISSPNDRLKVNPIPSLMDIRTNISTLPQSPEVLSPFSPGQVLADGKMKLQQSTKLPAALGNTRKIVPKLQPTDPREELKRRASVLNLAEPVYQICPTTIKNTKEPAVFAQVKIGPHGYSSYPEQAHTEDEAQKLAAKFALLDLTEKYGSSSCFNETKDKSIIKERVLSIIDAHPNGIFMHQIPMYYKQQYEEILPGNWEKVIETSSEIVLEKGVDNSVILRRFTSSDLREKIRNTTSLKTDKILLHPIGPVAPGQLQLPEEEFWIVSVTYVISTVEIWARIVGDAYSDEFDIMTTEMRKHYSNIQQSLKASLIEIGNYYVVFEDESWHRVRCVDFNITTGMVTVSFIDYGDEDIYHYSRLQILDKKFCVLPAQALRLCLYGLEDFNDCDSTVIAIEKCLLDRALYVEVRNRKKDQNDLSATVVFYDTHGPDDINLNLELFKQISQNVLVAPKLDVEGQVSEVFISHVEQNGDVYVQVQSESMKLLVNLLNRLICTGLNTEDLESCIVTTVDSSKTYFVSVNNNWYRGKIVSDSFYNQLRAFLIDFGKTVTVTKSNLLSLETLSQVLANYPPQALKVHLHNIDKSMFNEKMVAKLVELAPKGEPLIVKVVSSIKGTPVVELFKRIQPSNMLVSVNNTLALEEEITKTHGDGNNNIKPRKRIERMNSKFAGSEDDDVVKSLKPPKISGIGEYFDVHVTMAAHPGNFTVQPFDDKRSLELMMIQLQEACQVYKGPTPTPESVKEGKLYAAQHIDSHWYRVCISSIIKENMVSVYFCDFGDVSVLPLNKLQPLKSEFLELPYQAIKARLAGIRPINVDWSVEDSLRFQELVVDKNFVSIVYESKSDGFSPADTILGLKLIDVNTAEDIYIDQLLIEEGRATLND
ncbi:tudor domain-containing protein 7-like [Bombus vosnesenskii]|uniref:Tudor domain-containing protein 7-like n=1 Tax=Bombus vosnesenskii TaxID=207650 RepID=A0A6J3KCJ0_9HYME|nr:tudor domain-containing protein 7-like [Bombus vosnesenskii]XP_033350172.1 tudor domain-containing protein 7-like [Bombus vosnesenskii]